VTAPTRGGGDCCTDTAGAAAVRAERTRGRRVADGRLEIVPVKATTPPESRKRHPLPGGVAHVGARLIVLSPREETTRPTGFSLVSSFCAILRRLAMPTLFPCFMDVPKFPLHSRAIRAIRHVCYPFAELMLSIP
jgi:hypothetical protein